MVVGIYYLLIKCIVSKRDRYLINNYLFNFYIGGVLILLNEVRYVIKDSLFYEDLNFDIYIEKYIWIKI